MAAHGHGVEAAANVHLAIGDGLDARQDEGHGLDRDPDTRGSGLLGVGGNRTEQAQAALGRDQTRGPNPGAEVLENQLLEIKQGQGIHRLHPLTKAEEFGTLNPEESIGDGLLLAAPHQQLQIETPPLPIHRGFGKVGEEHQPVVATGQPQLKSLLSGVEGNGSRQVEGVLRPGGMQGEIQHKPIALQDHRAPLQVQVGAAKAGIAEPQGQAELGPAPAKAVTPLGLETAAQANGHGRQQGEQGERQGTDAEAAIALG